MMIKIPLDIMPIGIVYYYYRDNNEAKTMGRLKGSTNKISGIRPKTSLLSSEERIKFLANIIIDRIVEDEKNGQPLLNKIKEKYGVCD
jgi:hypothetical protein